jgi:transcription initiation factor TFIIH subunit 1
MPDSSPSTSNAANLAAAVSHAKIPGTLHVSTHMLNWSPTSSSLASKNIGIPLSHIDRLLASVPKPESTTFSLKLVFYQNDDPEQRFLVNGKGDVLFTFTAPEGRERALADREAFKERLAQVAQRNKNEREEDAEAGTSAGPSRGGSVAPALQRSASTADGRNHVAASPAPVKQEMSAEEKAKRREQELQLRISILQSNPDLKALHADLVITGLMRDAEFWSHPTRASLLRSERAVMQQRQGRNAMIADPKPSNDGDGNLKINLSAQMVRDMFEQYPVVAKAYDELVPKQVSIGQLKCTYR